MVRGIGFIQVGGTLTTEGRRSSGQRETGQDDVCHTPEGVSPLTDSKRTSLEKGGDGVTPDILVYTILRFKANARNVESYHSLGAATALRRQPRLPIPRRCLSRSPPGESTGKPSNPGCPVSSATERRGRIEVQDNPRAWPPTSPIVILRKDQHSRRITQRVPGCPTGGNSEELRRQGRKRENRTDPTLPRLSTDLYRYGRRAFTRLPEGPAPLLAREDLSITRRTASSRSRTKVSDPERRRIGYSYGAGPLPRHNQSKPCRIRRTYQQRIRVSTSYQQSTEDGSTPPTASGRRRHPRHTWGTYTIERSSLGALVGRARPGIGASGDGLSGTPETRPAIYRQPQPEKHTPVPSGKGTQKKSQTRSKRQEDEDGGDEA